MIRKGKYKPSHPEKYVGDPSNIIYRSSWERRCMIWLDREKNVISWASEELAIPYHNPVKNRRARYFPDFLVKVNTKDGKQKTILIEVKPSKQCSMPEKKSKKTQRYLKECATFAVNTRKWQAATEYCKDHGWEFMIVTEKELGIK